MPAAPGPAPGAAALSGRPFPDDLALEPLSRRPLVLPAATVDRVLGRPLPGPVGLPVPPPEASVVVVTHGHLAVTRMCVESLLSDTEGPPFELVVVDNASADATPDYLAAVAGRDARVRPLFNHSNAGFAAAVNTGLRAARGDVLVVLNNDVVVAPGWLGVLRRHLDDREVGLVGPVTNAAPNEARVRTTYGTYGGFLAEAAERRRDGATKAFDIPVATMFCVAFRRDVLDAVGPLDERFGTGMFEDDDYSWRVRRAGYRVTCAEGVLVHHFGEASLGSLVPTGEHAALFRANRRRFEEKWGTAWHPHAGRADREYAAMVDQVRAMVDQHVPPGALVLVVTKGDDQLLRLGDRTGVHLPSDEDGRFAGHHPADGAAVVAEVVARERRGARFVVVPGPSRWWLDHYAGFARHLGAHYDRLVDQAGSCVFGRREEPRAARPAAPVSAG